MNMNTVHGDPNIELIAPFLSVLDDATMREIYLPDSVVKELRCFDATLKMRLDSLEVPDALDSASPQNSIPNCVCTCGHRHVARSS